MASGRELSYVLLCGILASYACTFVILAEPSFLNCTREAHSHIQSLTRSFIPYLGGCH